jgi:hypothetical protein
MGSVVSPYSLGGLALQATTGPAGYTLVNGTGNILTWTPPNDGQLHRVVVISSLHVTTTEVGGAIRLTYTTPDGTGAGSLSIYGGNTVGPGIAIGANNSPIVQANATVALTQTSALTSGAAVLWAELWGS